MSNLKVSYLITYHNQSETIAKLIEILHKHTPLTDQILPAWDSINGDKKTKEIVDEWHKICYNDGRDFLNNHIIPFNDDYSAHKNLVTNLSNEMSSEKFPKSDFFFQIDGDEIPSVFLLENLHEIIESNPSVELIYVPRINDFKGVTQEHANHWGWRLTESSMYKRPIVNWPDYQGRIYRNVPGRIKWDRKLHEKIVGHNEYSFLPDDEDYALYHDKTIEKQLETNKRYNEKFSEEDNKGHKVR